MLRKRDTLPGRAWQCFVKIHPFPQFAPKREPPGVPGETTGEAVRRNAQNSSALSVSRMGSRKGTLFLLFSRLLWEPFPGLIWEPLW